MTDLNVKGALILSKDGHRHSSIYRGFMELLARFGYASIEEFRYGFGLPLQRAVHRLWYLEKAGLITRFKSRSQPESFFCLSAEGREAVKAFGISEELHVFYPSDYRRETSDHTRGIIKVFLALRHIFGDRFLGWTSEQRLKEDEEWRQKKEMGREKRILDGVAFLKVRKTRYKARGDGELEPTGETLEDTWRCGVEVELSAKSSARYEKQFKSLARLVYDSFHEKQLCPLVMMFYEGKSVHNALAGHLRRKEYKFGNCIICLAEIGQFLEKRGEAAVEKYISGEERTITAKEMGEVNVLVSGN